jgi:hypothetical protein|nr:MAG TPA: hypothetical protein [Caudoviricetes sp.]DAX59838.1 MAG TPA: hypothetical protein [Caudoviricetes sp.]
MYAVINNDSREIIAYHEDEEVVEFYLDSVEDDKKDDLSIIKIKKKYKEEIVKKYEDLHLVRFRNTYVQSGYLIYIKLSSQDILDDEEYARDILLRIIETQNLNNNEIKKLSKAIEVVDRLINEDKTYTPSYNELKRMRNHYDLYMYNKDI